MSRIRPAYHHPDASARSTIVDVLFREEPEEEEDEEDEKDNDGEEDDEDEDDGYSE